jgi:hypothetical protein
MAVVPRPLADATAHRRPCVMRIATAVLTGGLLLVSGAEALDVSLDPYREARRAGALGVVTGRVYAEPRTPSGPPRPMAGTTVVLLPRSSALWSQFERLKQQSRESSTAFAAAVPAMRKAKEGFERDLVQAGAPDLTLMVAVEPDGSFRIDDVPAGAWMLVGWHSTPVDVSTPRTKVKDRKLYQPRDRLQGYQSVTVWLHEVTVTGRDTATLELTDRTGWFRGVIEERVRDTGR